MAATRKSRPIRRRVECSISGSRRRLSHGAEGNDRDAAFGPVRPGVFPARFSSSRDLVADAPGGTVTFQGTVDTSFSSSCDGGCDLTVSASTINFGGALGGINKFGAVSLTSTSGTMFLPSISANRNITLNGLAELTGDITSSGGGILFANAVTLGADATINSGVGTTTFASTVNGDRFLTVRGGVVDFDANVGSVTPLGALSVTAQQPSPATSRPAVAQLRSTMRSR